MMLLALVYLWPALVAGKVLSPNSVLFLFTPWHAVAPPDFEHSWNPILSDIPTAYYPWNVLARELIRSGSFPSWNPYSYSGTSFYANAQTGIFSPFNLPLWILPLNYGIALSAWLKLTIGGFGAYLLARELRLGFWPGILAGVSFLLCAFNVVWITYQTLPGVAAMLPWMLLAAERIARRGQPADAIGLAFAAAITVAAGHPETAVQAFVATAVYIALRVLTVDAVDRSTRRRRLILTGAGLAGGGVLAAAVWIPVIRAGLGTPGAAARTNGGLPLPWSALKTALFPNWWEHRKLPLPGPANYNVRTLYVGVGPLLLAGSAIASRARRREMLALIALGALGIAMAFGVPVVHWTVAHVPPLDHTTAIYALLWYELAIAVLAAFGLQALLDSPRRQRAILTALAGAVSVGLFAIVTMKPSLHELRTTLNHFRTGLVYDDTKIISLTSIGWMLVFAVLLAGLLALMRRHDYRSVVAAALVVVVALDLLHFADGYQPMLAPRVSTPPATPAVRYLQRHAGADRVVGIGSALTNDYDAVYGLHDVRGYDPPQPSYRYWRLWQLANPTQIAVTPFEVTSLSAAGLKVLALLGVRYVLGNPGQPPLPGLRSPAVYSGGDATIYETYSRAPRTFVAGKVLLVANERAALRTIASSAYTPGATVVVERDQLKSGKLPLTASAGSATVTADENAAVKIRARLSNPGVVVLNDSLADGWHVTVDGQPRPALRVDDVMRGVLVPAGSHVVEWRYTVPGLKLGLMLSLIGLALSLGGLIRWRWRAAMRPADDSQAEPTAAGSS